MTDIPNTEYITIDKDGIFVGGKRATTYRGESIPYIYDIKRYFARIQRQNPEIQELHVGAFETKGQCAKPGNPSSAFGPNAWCRVKLFDGRMGSWVFDCTYSSASSCAYNCACLCGIFSPDNSGLRSGLLNFVKEPDLKTALKKVDLSKFVGKTIELNGYVITIQKQR